MKKLFIHNFFFRVFCPPFTGIVIYLLVLLVFDSLHQLKDNFFKDEAFLCIGLAYIQLESFRLFIWFFDKWLKKEDEVYFMRNILLQVFGSLFTSALIVSIAIAGYFIYVVGYTVFDAELIILNAGFAFIGIFYNMLYLSVHFLNKQNHQKLEMEQKIQLHTEYQLESFKNQVNPNLLYTCLESLISLIHVSPEVAEDFIDQMATHYRYALEHQKEETVDIRQEVVAAQNLLALLNEQYQQNISLLVDIEEEDLDSHIVLGTLQRLVEYIVNRSIISKTQPLKLHCFFESDDYLILQSPLNERLLPQTLQRKQLESLQKMYAWFSSEPLVEVKVDGMLLLKIPIVKARKKSNDLQDLLKFKPDQLFLL